MPSNTALSIVPCDSRLTTEGRSSTFGNGVDADGQGAAWDSAAKALATQRYTMDCVFEVTVEEGRIHVSFVPGTRIDPVMVREAFDKMVSVPEATTYDYLWDMRGSTLNQELTFSVIHDLHGFMKHRTPPGRAGRKAAIIAADDASYGVARMFQLGGAELPFIASVFRDLDAAEAWLAE